MYTSNAIIHRTAIIPFIVIALLLVNFFHAQAQDCDQAHTCEWVTIMYDGFENQGISIEGVIEGTSGNPTVHTIFPQGNFSGPSVFHNKARTGEGYMYMNFQNENPPTVCYSRTIDVCPNAEVRMSFWYRDLQPSNAGHSNRITIYDGSDSSSPVLATGDQSSASPQSVYSEFTLGPFTPTGTTLTMELANLLPRHTAGNDFIMDDLLFEQCDPDPIEFDIEICEGTDIDLYDYLSDCTGDEGNWTGSSSLGGNHLGTFNTDSNDLGVYRYTNGCLEYDINVNSVTYDVYTDYDSDVLCENDEQEVVVTVLPAGNFDVYWLHDNYTGDIRDLGPGDYEIIVTNLDNGCEIVESFEIFPEFADEEYITVTICEGESIDIFGDGFIRDEPGVYDGYLENQYGCDSTVIATLEVIDLSLDPAVDGILTCDNDMVDLTSPFTAAGNYDDAIIEWVYPNGDIDNGANITSNQEGWHYVTLTVVYPDGDSCTRRDSVLVDGNSDIPTFQPLMDVSIDCTGNQDATFSVATEPGNVITWTYGDEETSMETSITVNQTDTIYLQVLNPASGCEIFDTVTVMVDNDLPELTIEGNLIDCETSISELMGVTDAENIMYSWSHENNTGEISDQPNISVDSSGVYTLTITDENNCTVTKTYDVVVDTIAPVLNLEDAVIDCNEGEIMLATTLLGDQTITWSTSTDDNIGMTEMITVNEGGAYTATVINSTNHCESSQTINVTDLGDSPGLTISDGLLNCITDEITLNVISDQEDVSYIWTFEQEQVSDMDTTIATSGGDYTITATTNTGCTTIETITVYTDYATPTVTLENDEVLDCANTSATIISTVTDGDIYSWSGPNGYTSTSEYATANTPGDYTLIVTNSTSGCTETATIEVISNVDLPDVTLSDAIIDCNTPSIDADLFIDGPYASILWSGPNGFMNNTINPTLSETGDYNVVVTLDNGCMIERNMTLDGDFEVPTFDYVAGVIDCDQTSVTVDITTGGSNTILVTAPSGVTYNTTTFTTSEAGTYDAIITGDNGCTTDVTLEVEESSDALPLTLDGATVLDCNVESIILEISSDLTGVSEILWTLNGSELTTSDNYNATLPGEYIVSITADNGCITTESVTITQDITDPVVTIIEPEILDCITEEVALVSSSDGGTYSYIWSGPDGYSNTSSDAIAILPGTYTLISEGTNGCQTTSMVEVDQVINIINLDADGNDMDCIIDFSELSFTSDNDFDIITWTGPQGSSDEETWLVSNPGTYTITLTDEYGCEGQATIEITDTSEQPEINILSPDTIQLGVNEIGVIQMEVLNADDYIIEWMPQEGLSCYDCLNPQYTGEGEVEYTVTVTSASGCIDTDIVFIRRDIGPEIGVPNIISKNSSSNNRLTLYGNDSVLGIKEFLVYDRWGELIFSTENIPHSQPEYGWDGTFEGKDIVPGVYVYYFLIDTNIGEQKRVGDVTVMD